jgi:hypothetical protein
MEIWRRMINVPQHRDRKISSTSSPSKGKQRASQSLAWEDCIPEQPTNDLKVEVDESDNICRETELNRERELDHTLHAQINGKWTTQPHDTSIAELEGRILEPEQDELARETTPLLRNYILPPHTMEDDATSLTSEGKRQVCILVCPNSLTILEHANPRLSGTRGWREASVKSPKFMVKPSNKFRRGKGGASRPMGFLRPSTIKHRWSLSATKR